MVLDAVEVPAAEPVNSPRNCMSVAAVADPVSAPVNAASARKEAAEVPVHASDPENAPDATREQVIVVVPFAEAVVLATASLAAVTVAKPSDVPL